MKKYLTSRYWKYRKTDFLCRLLGIHKRPQPWKDYRGTNYCCLRCGHCVDTYARAVRNGWVKDEVSYQAPVIRARITRLSVKRNGIDVSEDIEGRNHRSNPFGWSQIEIWHEGNRIGWIESGYPMDFIEGYDAEVEVIG